MRIKFSSKLKLGLLITIITIASLGGFLGIFLYQLFSTPSIRIGALSGDLHHLPLFVALENDYFKDEGIDISSNDIYWFSNGNKVMTAFESGRLDVAYLGLAPAMAHKLNFNASIQIVSGVNVDGSAIMVKNNSGINTISDLDGTVIGVPSINNMQDFILQIALTNSGLNLSNVNRTILSVGNMENALIHGDINAYVAWEPFNAKALNSGVKYLNKSSEIWPNHPCCIMAASLKFLESNSEDVRKIVKIHKRALQWIINVSNHDTLIEIIKKYTGITEDTYMNSTNIIENALDNVGYIYNFSLYQSEIQTFYNKLTSLNKNIVDWPTGYGDFYQNFFNTTFLNT
ncbi:MAG: ABC transporter substrate-binding protein [Candidatus Lokiarchaeota archaeon]|nr:ABC transporter substrate-binding protein [Candidatus Lokiarchaeota archaeon]